MSSTAKRHSIRLLSSTYKPTVQAGFVFIASSALTLKYGHGKVMLDTMKDISHQRELVLMPIRNCDGDSYAPRGKVKVRRLYICICSFELLNDRKEGQQHHQHLLSDNQTNASGPLCNVVELETFRIAK